MNRIIPATTALLLALALPHAARAQTKIGYINSQNILAEAPGAKDAQTKFDAEMGQFKDEVQKMQTELEALVKQYDQQQAMLSPSAKQQRQADIQTKQKAYQDRLAAIDQRAGQRQQELVQPVMDKINKVIETIRAEGTYAIIFDVSSGGVVAADPGLDLTAEVIRRLKAEAAGTQAGR